jgi:hypothetical protein
MSVNLVSSLMQMITPDLVGRIASQVGIDKAVAEKALAGGVPALLAALLSVMQRPGGKETVGDAVAKYQPGAYGSASFPPGTGPSTIESGASTLASLLGGSTLSILSGALQRYAGTNGGAASSILGYLAPLVLGGIGQQARASGQSPTELLSAQKDTIMRALPGGLASALSAGGLVPPLTPPAQRHGVQSARASGSSGWMLPAFLGLGLLGIAWYFLTPPVPAMRPDPARQTVPTAPSLDSIRGIRVGEVEVGTEAAEAITGLSSTLRDIDGEPSGEAALPALQAQSATLERAAALMSQLSPENRRLIANAVQGVRPSLEPLFDRVLAMPGVGPMIKPTVENVRADLDRLTKA